MGLELLLFMGILVLGMFVMNNFAKKSQQKRQTEQENTLREQMVPGAWVQTYSGFFGRFVDVDGDVVILETPSGEETYWLRAAIRAVTDPPFEVIEVVEEDVVDVISDDTDNYDFDRAEKELKEELKDSPVEESVTEIEITDDSEGSDSSSGASSQK